MQMILLCFVWCAEMGPCFTYMYIKWNTLVKNKFFVSSKKSFTLHKIFMKLHKLQMLVNVAVFSELNENYNLLFSIIIVLREALENPNDGFRPLGGEHPPPPLLSEHLLLKKPMVVFVFVAVVVDVIVLKLEQLRNRFVFIFLSYS